MATTALLFPGQGAQTVGMGRDLAHSLPAAKALFDHASELLGYDIARLCFEGPAEKLDSTIHSQPALFVTSLAALESLRVTSPGAIADCRATGGLSLGEYTALVFAGALDFDNGLRLVRERGAAMQEAAEIRPGGMVSILGLELAAIQSICDQTRQDDVLEVANLLCPGNVVISGGRQACERAASLAESAGAMKAISLPVAGAFHTRMMQPAVDRLAKALADAPLSRPRIPVISNVDAQLHDDPDEIRGLLIRQVIEPVRWEDSMRYLLGLGVDQFYEVGPGRVLRGLLRRIDRRAACTNTSS